MYWFMRTMIFEIKKSLVVIQKRTKCKCPAIETFFPCSSKSINKQEGEFERTNITCEIPPPVNRANKIIIK